jgi:hypothetical protein
MLIRNSLFVIATLFGLGILIMFLIGPAINSYIAPTLLNAADDDVRETIESKFVFIQFMLDKVPYILFFSALIYIIIIAFRKEEVSVYE